MWTERYRPKTLEDVMTDRSRTLLKSIQENPATLPHLLLYGPPGTGKTSTALAIAAQVYAPTDSPFWVKFLNASDQRGIDVVRGPITDFCEAAGLRTTARAYPFKFLILDEADAMTPDAQRDLRAVIERAPSVRFCFIANYLSKVHDAIQSRCTLVRFPPVPRALVKAQIERVAAGEHLPLTPAASDILVGEARGDLRRAIHLLQTVAPLLTTLPPDAQPDAVWGAVGKPSPTFLRDTVSALRAAPPHQRAAVWTERLGKFLLLDILEVLVDLVDLVDGAHLDVTATIPHLAELERRLLHEGGSGMAAHRASLMSALLRYG